MKIKKELRRWAMLALVLVLLFSNTVGASADTGEPTVIVDSYGALYTAIAEATTGEVIGIKGVISIPSIVTLDAGDKYIVIKRMDAGAKLLIEGDYGQDKKATFKGFHFDGNNSGEKPVGGTTPFIAISGNAYFNMCDFEDCFYERGSGGAVYISSGDVSFSACRFIDNCADYGASIFSRGTLTLENCIFKENWAEEMGGAIYNAGTLTIRDTEIKNNTARIGGGLYSNASTEIYNSLIWSNTASVHGADLANEGSLSNYTTDDEYNSLLNYYNLFYAGWADDLNTNVGGAGEYRKFLTTDVNPTPPEPTDPPVEPTEPPAPTTPTDPDPTEPTEPEPKPEEPDKGDGAGGGDPTTPPEEPTTPDEGGKPTDPPTTPPDKDPVDPDPKPSTPSDTEQGGNNDNSTTDNSITDNSNHSTTDNSQHSSNVSNVDNSSQVGSTDNSRSESSKTENSHNTTTHNYYQTEQDKGSTGAPQSLLQPITVNVTAPQAKELETGTQEPTEAKQSIAQNIHIEAEGVNVNYEYTADGVSISISPYIAPESPKGIEAVPTSLSTISTPQELPENSISWVDYVSMILLALLVLAELKDRLTLKKGA